VNSTINTDKRRLVRLLERTDNISIQAPHHFDDTPRSSIVAVDTDSHAV